MSEIWIFIPAFFFFLMLYVTILFFYGFLDITFKFEKIEKNYFFYKKVWTKRFACAIISKDIINVLCYTVKSVAFNRR